VRKFTGVVSDGFKIRRREVRLGLEISVVKTWNRPASAQHAQR